MRRRALLLAGGGMRVAWQAGVVKALADAGLEFGHVDATSGGTINLSMLLSGLSPDEMCQRWRSLDVSEFVSPLPLAEYLHPGGALGLADADGIVGRLFPHLGIDIDRIRAAPERPVGTFNVCSFTRKLNLAVPHSEMSMDLLVAAISLPGAMPPVTVGDEQYLDSVWIKDTNVQEAVRRGAEEIFLVWCIGNGPNYERGAFRQYVHMIELSANGVLFEELRWVAELNVRIAAGDSPYGQRVPIRLKVIKPEYPLPLDPSYFLGHIDGHTLVAQGYADARRRLARLDEDDPLDHRCTAMLPRGESVGLRERFRGTDTAKPAVALGVRVAVQVPDLETFAKARVPTAPVHGWLGVDELEVPIEDGMVCLEPPTPAGRRIAYRGRVHLDGLAHDFEMARTLHDDPGFDGIRDLETAHLELREVGAAQPRYAGDVRWSNRDLLEFLDGIQAVEPPSIPAGVATVARFTAFLLGDVFSRPAPRRRWWQFWRWWSPKPVHVRCSP